VKSFIRFTTGILLFGLVVFSAQASFTNLYVFGDCISTTTNNTSGLSYYYGQRYSNGRVWVEVLAQRQGLTYDPNKNWSYFYNSSTTMLANVSSFSITPSNANNALFVIWVNCADLWFQAKYGGTSLSSWTNAINQSQTNHYKAITNLYAKGARTLILPNAVDVSTIPAFNTSANVNFIHLRCLDYNVAFSNTLNRIRASCPNLTLYTPDFFGLLTNMLAHPSSYGLTNAVGNGKSIDAVDAVNFNFPSAATNGFGTNFIFWDPQDPTAMVHAWMANTVQQLISPVRIGNITAFNGSNQLDMANVPVGQNGLVLGRTNLILGNWKTNMLSTSTNVFNSTNTTQTIFVPSSGPQWFYQLKFPYSWNWP
jgi:phospholipase/lecithinase/hemolysin